MPSLWGDTGSVGRALATGASAGESMRRRSLYDQQMREKQVDEKLGNMYALTKRYGGGDSDFLDMAEQTGNLYQAQNFLRKQEEGSKRMMQLRSMAIAASGIEDKNEYQEAKRYIHSQLTPEEQKQFGDPDTWTRAHLAAFVGGKDANDMLDSWNARYKAKKKGGNLTLTQQAKNEEIDTARAEFINMGLTKEEVRRRTSQYTSTGKTNNDYDPVISKIYNKAIRRKVGEDPDYKDFYNSYVGAGGEKKEEKSKFMNKLPDAAKHKGRSILELDAQGKPTGRRLKSNGKSWEEAKAGEGINLAMNADEVPIGSGLADQTRTKIMLQKALTEAYAAEDDVKIKEIEKQIQEINNQYQDVG